VPPVLLLPRGDIPFLRGNDPRAGYPGMSGPGVEWWSRLGDDCQVSACATSAPLPPGEGRGEGLPWDGSAILQGLGWTDHPDRTSTARERTRDSLMQPFQSEAWWLALKLACEARSRRARQPSWDLLAR